MPRPSSPLNAKASVRSPYALDRSQQNPCAGTRPPHLTRGSCATASSTRLSFEFVVRRCFFIKSALEALEMPGRPFLHDVNRQPRIKVRGGETCRKRDRDPSQPWARKGWWSQTGSNRRPHACKARALPTELWPHRSRSGELVDASTPACRLELVGPGRFELPTSPLSGVRSNQLSYGPPSPT